jgi:polysaccharide pyruvyl transferase CsaB
LQKRLKFKLVTSAHSDFSVAFPFNLLSNWGDKVLAVSSDIKDYLLENYKVQERNISLTVNGIDTDKFNPDIDVTDIKAELGLAEDTCKIVCVGRLDKGRVSGLAAQTLVDIAEDIKKQSPRPIEIIIVGDGPDFAPLQAKADAVNAKLGKIIHMTGQRIDINKFCALADIFVNPSRAALEAMSAGTPAILAGNQGYVGILDETTKATAVATNFTCRGCGETTPEKLSKDLLTLLNMSDSQLAALGAYSRNLICTEYSLERMAKDAIRVYDKVFEPDNPVNVVISGYYGYNNSGDDIMLKSILQNLRARKDNLNVTVLSPKPKETRRQFGVDAVHRFNPLAVFMRLRKAKLLITGGGNLIQDETSTHSLLYYLLVINTARFLGAKNMLYAKGIGPVNRRGNIGRVRRSIDKVDLITLREGGSLDVLQAIGITRPDIHVTADAAFALPPSEGEVVDVAEYGIHKPFFCIALRPWTHNPTDLEMQVARFADHVVETYGYQAVFIPMRPEQDSDIAQRVMALMKHPAVFLETSTKKYDIGRSVMGQASFAICMRLHALIYAMEKGVPAIGLEYNTKIRGFMEAMEQKWHIPVEEANADTLMAFAQEIHENKEAISAAIFESGCRLRELSARNAELCVQLLEEV